MSSSTFKVRVGIPRKVRIGAESVVRDDFFAWAWASLSEEGLQGVHEGTLLSEEAVSSGLETESWTVDAGEAPRERDWVSSQEIAKAELYFATPEGAQAAADKLRLIPGLQVGQVEEQVQKDWDADWKASFQGARVPPFWSVLPPWVEPAQGTTDVVLRVNPGAGFGTGTHETTQLCLEVLGNLGRHLTGTRVLDFGSGSGILSIAAALLGAEVSGVEIDPLAIDNALENAGMNGVQKKVHYSRTLASAQGPHGIVIANILKPVLLEFAPELVKRLAPGGKVILSGLMEPDVAAVSEAYSALLDGKKPAVRALGEWRALYWA